MIISSFSQRITVGITSLSLILTPGLVGPAAVFAHHPTTQDIPGWVHMVVDVRWGNVVLEPETFTPVTYSGTVTLSGTEGVVAPMHPYNWEWHEDKINFTAGATFNPRSFTFTSVIHNSWDGLRLRVAGPKTAMLKIQLNSFTYEKDLVTLATTHAKEVQAIGQDHDFVIRSMPLRDPVALVNIWWGRIADRNVAYRPELQQGAPLSLNPFRKYATLFNEMTGSTPSISGFDAFHSIPDELKSTFLFPERTFDAPTNFSGSFTAPAGTLRRAKPRSFEENDGIVSMNDSSIAWESMIAGKAIGSGACPAPIIQSSSGTTGTTVYPAPTCPIYHMDRDGMMVALRLGMLTGSSPLTLKFESADVNYTKTVTLEELFLHPFRSPILVRGTASGYGVMMAIHEVPDKKLLRARGHAEVFMVEDGVRRHVPDPVVFEEQGFEWEEIDDVDVEEVNALPEDDEAVPMPDGEVLQAEGDPTVYVIDDGLKRPVPSPQAFQDMGLKWEHILQVPTSTLDRHPVGPNAEALPSGSIPPPDGLTFRIQGDPRVYRIEDGARYHVPSPESFQMHRLDWPKVAELAPNHPFAGLLQKGELPPPDGTLIRSQNAPTVFQYEDGVAKPIDDLEDFQEMKLDFKDVHVLPPQDVAELPIGGTAIANVPDVTAATPFTAPLEAPPAPTVQ